MTDSLHMLMRVLNDKHPSFCYSWEVGHSGG